MTNKHVVIQIHDRYKDKTLEWFEGPYIGLNPPMVSPGEGIPYYKGEPFTGTIEYFDKEGNLEIRESFKEGYQHGSEELFNKNGQLSWKRHFKNGKLEGPYEEYHENGQLIFKCNYKNDELHGPYEWFHENGQLINKQNYKNGKLIE